MKGKKFYITLIVLFLIGIGSVFTYRHQQEVRALEFEGYEIAAVEGRIDTLYNGDKTDIQENISRELSNLEQIISELKEKDLNSRNKKRIEKMENTLMTAKVMYELQEEIINLYTAGGIVHTNTSVNNIEDLQTLLAQFEDKTVYYNRNNELLTEGSAQLQTIEEATELVEQLMTDGILNENVNEKSLEEIEELIDQIKNVDIKEHLIEQLVHIRLVFDEFKIEDLVLEEAEDLEEEDTEEIFEETTEEESDVEENVETVQETTQPSELKNPSTAKKNNKIGSSQSTKAPNRPTNNQTNNPSSNQSSTTEQKAEENKVTVVKKFEETKVIEKIPYETFIYENNNIAAGEEIVYSEGQSGEVTETYEIINYNNGTSSRKLISSDKKDPVDRIITVGTKEPETVVE